MKPSTELKLTILPFPCRRIVGNTALVTRRTPKTFTSNNDLAWATEDSSAPPSRPMPALLTSRSMRPASASTSSTSFATDASSVTSQVSMVTPSARSAAARRLVPNTRKPAFCRALAVAYPMPVDAPVTRATPGLVLLMKSRLSLCWTRAVMCEARGEKPRDEDDQHRRCERQSELESGQAQLVHQHAGRGSEETVEPTD